MSGKSKSGSRTSIRGKGWKRSPTIATEKYAVISKAIVSSLTRAPITFSELVRLVSDHVKNFKGSIPWYTICCLRELEIQGRVVKLPKPVLYAKR
jgi:hypothetical protein